MARQRASQQAQAAFSRVGTGYVPPAADSDDQEDVAWSRDTPAPERQGAAVSRSHDVATPRDGEATAPRRRRGPVAAEAEAFTVRFGQDEAIAVDELVLAMRRAAGRRVDKSELVRTLLRLARDREDLRQAIAGELRDD